MKQFLWGVAATVVGGFLLFFATNLYTDWVAKDSNELTYQANPSVAFIDKFALDAILSIADKEGNTGKIGIVSIVNETDKDVRNAKILITPTMSDFGEDNFHGFGLANSFGADILNPVFEVKSEGIEVTIPLLEPEEGVVFWLAHEPPQGFKVFPVDENLSLKEDLSWLGVGESSLDFAFVFIIGVVCLAFGIWAGNAMSEAVIKKAGYNPKTINADYYKALALEKAREAAGDADDNGG